MEKQLLYLLDYDLAITEEEVEHRSSRFLSLIFPSLLTVSSLPRPLLYLYNFPSSPTRS